MRSLLQIFVAAVLCTVPACAVAPSNNRSAGHGNHPDPVPVSTPLPPEVVALRTRLIAEYKQVVESVFTDYHGIYADMVGRVVYVQHPLFSGYEFSAGPLTPAVQQWADARREELAKADIITAGIMSGSGMSMLPISRR